MKRSIVDVARVANFTFVPKLWKSSIRRLRGLRPPLARSNMIQKCQQYPDNYITGLRGRRREREMDVATREVGLLLRGMLARVEEEVATDRAQGDFPADL